jgi:hypothetical protein
MNTPGYNRRLEIKFTVTRKGQRRAWRYQRESMRWLPMPVADADLFIAQDQATEYKPAA